MGYTHYWRALGSEHDGDPSEVPAGWNKANKAKLQTALADMFKLAPILIKTVPLANDDGSQPIFNLNEVWFNGVGDNSHETFEINTKWDGEFNFCKTAAKPYDVAVTACLCLLKFHLGDAVNVSSDGDAGDWEEGLRLARIIQAGCENPIQPRR